MPSTPALRAVALICILLFAGGPALAETRVLERVVIVERHGVRPPTKSPEELAPLSSRPWPPWSVAPGELTAHGAATVTLMGASLRRDYTERGLLPALGCPAAGAVKVWADGADQRTRMSGEAVAEALAPGCGVKAAWATKDANDPLFSGPGVAVCPIDPAQAKAAFETLVGAQGVETAASRKAVARLQAIVAPQACMGGPGVCLQGEDSVSITAQGLRLNGPLATAATLSENLLLEYAEGKPAAEVGWGEAASPAVMAEVLPAHERFSDLTRALPYVAERRGSTLARAILAALEGDTHGAAPAGDRLTAFVGHDTNLANMAGVFGLDWTLPEQPDATAPATALVFELWRDPQTGATRVSPFVVYETLDQLRTLKPAAATRVALSLPGCGAQGCTLAALRDRIERRLALACPGQGGGLPVTTARATRPGG